jgi:hypothetical protein
MYEYQGWWFPDTEDHFPKMMKKSIDRGGPAEYQFQVVMGNCYWLVWHKRHGKNLLVLTGPNDWNTGVPDDYQYIMQVKYMGDHTWQEVILSTD